MCPLLRVRWRDVSRGGWHGPGGPIWRGGSGTGGAVCLGVMPGELQEDVVEGGAAQADIEDLHVPIVEGPHGLEQGGRTSRHRDDELAGMLVDIDRPGVGPVKTLGFPIYMSETPGRLDRMAPSRGQHSAQILHQLLGYAENRIVELEHDGVIG